MGERSRQWLAMMHKRLGRRGAFLLSWGVLFIIYGIGFGFSPLTDQPRSALVIHELIPYSIRALIWVGSGLLACVAAFRRSPGHDTFGFIALSIMPVIRTVSYLFAWAVSLLPFGDYGYDRGYVTAAFYSVFIVTIVLFAGVHEHHGYAPREDCE